MSKAAGRLRVGTSGYQYRHWRYVFYPARLAAADWLAFYAEHFDSVEINNTFYGLPAPETFDTWRRRTPPGFCFALKFSRYGSHMRRLRAPRATQRPFLERAQRLGPKLGPVLLQLPPRWHADPGRLEAFLAAFPGRRRIAVELRDPSWLCEPVYRVLRRHKAALCLHDWIERHPHEVTADFVYLRFHGAPASGRYTHQALAASARRVRRWLAAGLDTYAYFNNDAGGYAVTDATALRRYVAGA